MDMTLNQIGRKLIKNNFKEYVLFFFSVLFSMTMTGAYGVLQYSPTVTNVLIDGGSTSTISQAMFLGSMIGIIIFLIYANSIFLKYKSREIGIFLSLGINRTMVQKIIVKEFTILFQIATLIGFIFSIPMAYICWSLLNIFLETQETTFSIGWIGLGITSIFAILAWLILRIINVKYINRVYILKVLKASDTNDVTQNGSIIRLIIGFIIVPIGIIAFFTLHNIVGFINKILAFGGLGAAACGIYILIIQLASIGDILKRYNVKIYYKNIVFYNLLKQKIRQYTRSIFVATLLITFTIFSIGFIAAGFIDGYNIAINEPYDYTINKTYEQSEITEQRILEIATDTNTIITDIKNFKFILIGTKNIYSDGSTDWSSRVVVSQSNFNNIAETNISVSRGSYTLYYDSSMSYKLNAFSGDSSLFYNPSTKTEFTLSQNKPICFDGLLNSRSFFSSFLILSDEDFNQLSSSVGKEYKVTSYMVNVENWTDTVSFQDHILKEVIENNRNNIFINWHNSAIFDKTGSKSEYLSFNGNETRIARVWALYPSSKLSSATTQFEAFATYLMLMFFISVVAFVSSIMVIGLKLISTIWDDKSVYENLSRLGMKQKNIKSLITKQMIFVYFLPTILGCFIGAFTTYRIMLVSNVIYIEKTMLLIGGVCGFVLVLQIIIFFIIRIKIISNCIRQEKNYY